MGRILGKNLFVKIFALILASVLWMYVMNEQNPHIEASYLIPVEGRNLSSGLLLVDAPETVKVKIRGPRSVVAGMSAQDIKCYFDLKDLKAGQHSIKINTTIPQLLELIEVNPDKAIVRIDTEISRQLPVELLIKGTAANGTVVSKTVIKPTVVQVEGPKAQLDLVEKVMAIIDITGKDKDVDMPVTLLPINKEGKTIEGLTLTPDAVTIFLNLVKQENKKVLDVKLLMAGNLSQGVALKKITVKPDKVEVIGSKEVLDKITGVNTELINLSGIEKDTVSEVKLQPIEGANFTPDKVVVNITIESIHQQQ